MRYQLFDDNGQAIFETDDFNVMQSKVAQLHATGARFYFRDTQEHVDPITAALAKMGELTKDMPTRRERIATQMLAGIVRDMRMTYGESTQMRYASATLAAVRNAIELADMLIAELDK